MQYKYIPMRKKGYLFGLLFMTISGIATVQGQTIKNLRFTQDGKQIVISYDLRQIKADRRMICRYTMAPTGKKTFMPP